LDDSIRLKPQFGLLRQQRHDDGFEKLDAVLMQISPERALHLLDFFRLTQQFVQDHEDASTTSHGAFRASGAGRAAGLKVTWISVFHTVNNRASRY
jgi:hypothetical protein